MIDQLVTGQATTIAYQNDFLMMTVVGLICLPLIFAFSMRRQGKPA
jgi:hypothetical protein